MIKSKKVVYIIISVIMLSLLTSYVDTFIKPTYAIKSICKFTLFLFVPLFYLIRNKDDAAHAKHLFLPNKKLLSLYAPFGLCICVAFFIGYYILRNFIDFSAINLDFFAERGVVEDNFWIVTAYIVLINSLLEEFFFRLFAFALLKQQTNRKIAYIFSALFFALYHAGMTTGWFNIWLHSLTLLVLFISGCMFNFFVDRSNSIYSSWIVHACSNIGINTVGAIMLDII